MGPILLPSLPLIILGTRDGFSVAGVGRAARLIVGWPYATMMSQLIPVLWVFALLGVCSSSCPCRPRESDGVAGVKVSGVRGEQVTDNPQIAHIVANDALGFCFFVFLRNFFV